MPRPPVRTATHRLPTRLGSLHVEVVGDGVPTVFWSSMFVDSSTWSRLLPLLPGRRCVLIDPPGLGRSDPLTRRSSIREAADCALDALAELRRTGVIGESPVDWVGNAFGGHVGFELAARTQALASFVAISSPPEPVPAALRRQVHVLHPLLRAFGPVGVVRDAIYRALLTDASAADPTVVAVVDAALARPTRGSISRALRSFILDRRDVSNLLPAIQIPALYVAGDDRGDWLPADARRAAARSPRARAVTVEDSRTLAPLEQPVAVADALNGFWAG